MNIKYILIYILPHLFSCWCKKECIKAPTTCPKSRYRSFDGSCNNLKHPDWGMPHIRYRRLLPPSYGDGISTYRTAKSGKELPNARKISSLIYPDKDIKDPKYTLMTMQYGQIVTHDMSMITTDGNQNLCCSEDLQFVKEEPFKCAPIVIPDDDPYYSKFGAKCITFARIYTDKDQNCWEENESVEQLTNVNAFLDLSIIYGNGEDINSQIRVNKSGLLKTRIDKGQEWPLTGDPALGCPLSPKNETCFFTSDPRINQNPQLTLLHIIFYREHNRLARALAKINPSWDDNIIFEEARKINIAEHQQISYYEWLPLLLNKTMLLEKKVIYDSKHHIDDYDPNVDPSVLTEHNNAAFRIHTQIAGYLHLVDENRKYNQSLRISDWYWHSSVVEEKNYFPLLARGLTTQFSLASDEYHDSEITHFWFRRGKLGFDLRAIDIERTRDLGIGTYNKGREFCNLSVAKTFDDLVDIPKNIVKKISQLYETPEDIGLLVGGSVEKLVPGALVGPTFHCILSQQFLITRVGDRFWFERSSEFTLEQLKEIRNVKLSRLMCDNTKDVAKMQRRVFEKIDKSNPLLPCDDLPSLNLNKWKE